MALEHDDLALMSARFGVARFGATRFGFIPCPEDVTGSGSWPGEYIWREDHKPETDWTLVSEDCVCRNLCTLEFGTITPSQSPIYENAIVTYTSALSGVLGTVSGVISVDWGDGGHDSSVSANMVDGNVAFEHAYNNDGTYVVTFYVTDERGCSTSKTLTVVAQNAADLAADFTINVNGQGATGGSGAQTTGWVGDSTVSGGSGMYSYAWTVWNESTSEGSPLYTSTVADPTFPPAIPTTCVGLAKLVVTDTVTLLTVTVGPYDWDWNCI